MYLRRRVNLPLDRNDLTEFILHVSYVWIPFQIPPQNNPRYGLYDWLGKDVLVYSRSPCNGHGIGSLRLFFLKPKIGNDIPYSKDQWLWDKTTISHEVVMMLGFHKANSKVESKHQNYQVRYCGFNPQPWVFAFIPQIWFFEMRHAHWINPTISNGLYSTENDTFVV